MIESERIEHGQGYDISFLAGTSLQMDKGSLLIRLLPQKES